MAIDGPVRSAKISEELDGGFREYRDDNDLSDNEAMRQLLRAGIEAETGSAPARPDAGADGEPSAWTVVGRLGNALWRLGAAAAAVGLLLLAGGVALTPWLVTSTLWDAGVYAALLSAALWVVYTPHAAAAPAAVRPSFGLPSAVYWAGTRAGGKRDE